MVYIPPPVDICSISHEPFTTLKRENRLARLPCNHFFDHVSIETWVVNRTPCCPICERRVTVHDIRREPSWTVLGTISQIFWTVMEFLWKGILFLCEVSLEMQKYSVVHHNTYTTVRTTSYVPPRASSRAGDAMERARQERVVNDAHRGYVPTPAAGAGGRVQLGSREEPVRGPVDGARVPLGNRA